MNDREAHYIYNGCIHLRASIRLPIDTADSAISRSGSAEVSASDSPPRVVLEELGSLKSH